jgi:hypothetical protein
MSYPWVDINRKLLMGSEETQAVEQLQNRDLN